MFQERDFFSIKRYSGSNTDIQAKEVRIMAKKVLTVDDDPDVRLFTTTVLEENGYEPIEAGNGEEGLQMIKSEHPDLVILDVLMPRQSGIRLYRELKTSKTLANVKIIILSGIAKKTFLRSQQALTEFGETLVPEPDFYLEKPVEADVLAETIKKAIG
jgi:twitching motility two-component system response regulator PilH